MKPLAITVHQFHYAVRRYDAVSNHLRHIQKSLAAVGILGDIFASEIGKDMSVPVREFKRKDVWVCDLFLVHHSHGNPNLKAVLDIDVPKALVYHNITPASFFRHDPYLAKLCDLGRRQLSWFKQPVVHSFAVSQFNANELREVGHGNVTTLPLVPIESVEKKSKIKKGFRFLFVGRVTPHKNQAMLLKVFYYLKRELGDDVLLTLVGGSDPLYGDYVQLLARTLGLQNHVERLRGVSEKELQAIYQSSDAFLCTSLHEGFCVPLVEAMANGVPVFAMENSAITETLGGAGVPLRTDDPEGMAQTIVKTLKSESARKKVLAGQASRLEKLEKEQSVEKLQRQVLELLALVAGSDRLEKGSLRVV